MTVYLNGKGFSSESYSSAVAFSYIITVTSIAANGVTPATPGTLVGSVNGGTVLTFTGTNFGAAKNDN